MLFEGHEVADRWRHRHRGAQHYLCGWDHLLRGGEGCLGGELQNVLSAAQRLDKAVWFGKAVHGAFVQQPDAILAVARRSVCGPTHSMSLSYGDNWCRA
jgi:hypothetical protein